MALGWQRALGGGQCASSTHGSWETCVPWAMPGASPRSCAAQCTTCSKCGSHWDFEAVSHKSRRWESWRADKTFPSFSTRPARPGTRRSQLDRTACCRPHRGTPRAAGQPLLSQSRPAPAGAGLVTPRSRSAAPPSPWAQPSPILLHGSGQGDAWRNKLVGSNMVHGEARQCQGCPALEST